MADESPRPPSHRLGSLKGYLPLNDTSVATRGQWLPSLLQNRSYTSLREASDRASVRGASQDPDDDAGTEGDSSMRRRLSTFSTRSTRDDLLNTPQMRSMRLIGDSNPKYDWYGISGLAFATEVLTEDHRQRYYKGRDELNKMKKPMSVKAPCGNSLRFNANEYAQSTILRA